MALSIVIPVHNGGTQIYSCLQALRSSQRVPDEVIIVDDASTDTSLDIANQFGVRILEIKDFPRGPAFARNRGAEIACSDILLFLDADVVVHPETLGRIEKVLTNHPEVTALFGSYDDDPPHRGLISLYKNLQHHYIHHHSPREASTFWAGCGAIRRKVFLKLGGFNEYYKRPSIEDIELGLRLIRSGHKVWLCPEVQVTHLKQWTLSSWLCSDIFDRAIPWTRLILSTAYLPSSLNLDKRNRASAMAAWVSVGFFAAGFWSPGAWLGMLFGMVVIGLLNFHMYRLFQQKGGILFAIPSFCLHTIYYLYSSLIFLVVAAWYRLRNGLKNNPSHFMD